MNQLRKTTLLMAIACIAIIACNQRKAEKVNAIAVSQESPQLEPADKSKEESKSEAFSSSSAAVEDPNDTKHHFIRTAELKFKVKKVIAATTYIENTVKKMNGFVTYTNLKSTINDEEIVPFTADSNLITTTYTVSNDLIIRVPNTNLDSTLKQLAKIIDYLDYRTIKANDVSFLLLANRYSYQRAIKYNNIIGNASTNQKVTINEAANAAKVMADFDELAGNVSINNNELNDEIKYSTISLAIYQNVDYKQERIVNKENLKRASHTFGQELGSALVDGWEILKVLLLFIARIWILIIIIPAAYFGYRKFKSKI